MTLKVMNSELIGYSRSIKADDSTVNIVNTSIGITYVSGRAIDITNGSVVTLKHSVITNPNISASNLNNAVGIKIISGKAFIDHSEIISKLPILIGSTSGEPTSTNVTVVINHSKIISNNSNNNNIFVHAIKEFNPSTYPHTLTIKHSILDGNITADYASTSLNLLTSFTHFNDSNDVVSNSITSQVCFATTRGNVSFVATGCPN